MESIFCITQFDLTVVIFHKKVLTYISQENNVSKELKFNIVITACKKYKATK